jgi:proteasome lid subunit RPN8/RPN11
MMHNLQIGGNLLIKKVVVSRKIHDELIKLVSKYSPKIICGLLSGKKESDVVIIERFYPIPTICGPKIHFKPNWAAYQDVKNVIYDAKTDIVGEFHTHPDGMEELNINDRKILRKLGRGLWIIVTPQKVVPWYFEVIDKFKHICEKPDLELTK